MANEMLTSLADSYVLVNESKASELVEATCISKVFAVMLIMR